MRRRLTTGCRYESPQWANQRVAGLICALEILKSTFWSPDPQVYSVPPKRRQQRRLPRSFRKTFVSSHGYANSICYSHETNRNMENESFVKELAMLQSVNVNNRRGTSPPKSAYQSPCDQPISTPFSRLSGLPYLSTSHHPISLVSSIPPFSIRPLSK